MIVSLNLIIIVALAHNYVYLMFSLIFQLSVS